MRNLLTVGLVGFALVFVACGNTDRPKTIDDGGKGGSSGKGGFAPAAGKSSSNEGGTGPEVDPLAPVVRITAPAAVDDPNQEGVLVGSEVEVVCSATKSPEKDAVAVDGTSVNLQILDAAGKLLEEKPGIRTDEEDEYAATFLLTDVAAGAVSFRCIAEDLDEREGSDQIGSFLDKGPVISFTMPDEDNSFHPLMEVLRVDFTVEPALLTDDDEGAVVEEVELHAAGISIPLEDAEVGPGSYHLELNLRDGTLFNPPPNGPFLLTVNATNRRAPTPVTATRMRNLSVDGDGPNIVIKAPGNKAVVGGEEFLVFEVNDSVSGVEPESVVVKLNDAAVAYGDGDWGLAGNVFTYKFDSRTVPDAKVQITVNISATDRVGNQSMGASSVLYVDNFAPLMDMNPPNIRAFNDDGECSMSFDPLANAVNDLDKLSPAGRFRTIVWEITNTLPGVVGYLSGTKTDTVTLYLRHEQDGPLLEDTTGDGICDEIIDRDIAAFIKLDPITGQGRPSWGKDDDVPPAIGSLACVTKDTDLADKIMCGAIPSDMSYVINHDTSPEAVVWSIDVGAGTCTGNGWDISTKLAADGWVCVSTRAEDNAGNIGVSPPIRVCVDDPDIAGVPPCLEAEAPSCVDACTPPPGWQRPLVTAN